MSTFSARSRAIPLVEPWFPPEYADAVRDQILSGFIGPGTRSKAFADELARFAGVKGCVLTVSGTVALSVAARALKLQPGDEVLVPAYGVISTINAFASLGLRPKLVEIDRPSGCMSYDHLLKSISNKTKAVCYVEFSGNTGAELEYVTRECTNRNLPLIEDAACALGQRYKGRASGSFGTIGIYSFSVPKVLTTGQGGAVLSNDQTLLDSAGAFVDQGDLEWRRTNINRGIGTNLRFTDIQASLGLSQLHDIESRLERRHASFSVLREMLSGYLYEIAGSEAPLHNIVFTDRPDDLVEALRKQEIFAARQYRTISGHPAYADLAGNFPNADYWTSHAVYLPFGMSVTPEDAERIANAVSASGVPLLPWRTD